jgi:hypothetical protein
MQRKGKNPRVEKYVENLKQVVSRINLYPAEMSKELKWSKQKLNYWLKKFEELGFLKSGGAYYLPYTLTEKGEFVKKSFIEGEPPTSTKPTDTKEPKMEGIQAKLEEFRIEPILDIHNSQILIPIVRKGNLPDGTIKMRNWSYFPIGMDNMDVRVHYGDKTKLLITIPKQTGMSLREVSIKEGMIAYQTMVVLQKKYGCIFDLENIEFSKKPQIHVFNDPIMRELAKHIKFAGLNIQVNESGGAKGELTGWNAAIRYDKLINDVPERVEEMNSRIGRIEESMMTFAVAMDEHVVLVKSLQEVAMAMMGAIKELRNSRGAKE